MVSAMIFALAAMASGVFAVPKCRPSPTVPVSGVLKKIAIDHGLQNYTCTSTTQPTAQPEGALSVLYDVTNLYPGKAHGLERAEFDALPITTMYGQDIPLSMTQSGPNVYAATAVTASRDNTSDSALLKLLYNTQF